MDHCLKVVLQGKSCTVAFHRFGPKSGRVLMAWGSHDRILCPQDKRVLILAHEPNECTYHINMLLLPPGPVLVKIISLCTSLEVNMYDVS